MAQRMRTNIPSKALEKKSVRFTLGFPFRSSFQAYAVFLVADLDDND